MTSFEFSPHRAIALLFLTNCNLTRFDPDRFLTPERELLGAGVSGGARRVVYGCRGRLGRREQLIVAQKRSSMRIFVTTVTDLVIGGKTTMEHE